MDFFRSCLDLLFLDPGPPWELLTTSLLVIPAFLSVLLVFFLLPLAAAPYSLLQMPLLPPNMVPIPGLFSPEPALLLLGSGRETPASLLFIHPPSETSDSNIQLLRDLNSLMPQGLLTLMAQIEILIFPPVPPSLSLVTSPRPKAQAWKTCDSPLPPYPLTLPKLLSPFCPPLFHCPISASQIPT